MKKIVAAIFLLATVLLSPFLSDACVTCVCIGKNPSAAGGSSCGYSGSYLGGTITSGSYLDIVCNVTIISKYIGYLQIYTGP